MFANTASIALVTTPFHVMVTNLTPMTFFALTSSIACFRLLPFIINTGGSSWDQPIIGIAYCSLHIAHCALRVFPSPPSGDPTLRHFGIPDARKWRPPYDDKFDLPTPLGRIIHPFYETWDQARVSGAGKGSTTKYDIRFNLVGHELAEVIDKADGFAFSLRRHPERLEVAFVVFCRPIYGTLSPFRFFSLVSKSS